MWMICCFGALLCVVGLAKLYSLEVLDISYNDVAQVGVPSTLT